MSIQEEPPTVDSDAADPVGPSVSVAPGALGRNPPLTILAACAVVVLLQYMQEVLIPFVLAGLTFYALDPLVDRLQKWRIPRALGAAIALAILIGSVSSLGYSLSDDVIAVAN